MASAPSSYLPEELLELIFESFTDLFDLLQCRGVCLSWRSEAKRACHDIVTPLLLLPSSKTSDSSEEHGKLVNVCKSTTKLYRLCLPNSLSRTHCISSYRGWLLIGGDTMNPHKIHLYNPLSRVNIQLPPLLPETEEQMNPVGFVSSSSPTDPNCTVLVLYQHRGFHNACICKPGDQNWTSTFVGIGNYDDMIYYRGELYAIDKHGVLKRLNFGDRPMAEEVPARAIHRATPIRYLAESASGELLMVARHVGSDNFSNYAIRTKAIEVFKLDWSNGVWEEVSRFGDQALLLAHNDSMFVPAAAGGGAGFRRDCIYFVDDLWGDSNSNCKDYGVYELRTGKIELFNQSPETLNAAPIYRWLRPGT